ncbi:MAG: HD domain-containing protein [Clostridia bacterium]|nr:HD domain-containing protein [Clostridia bacterium]
MNQHRYDHTLRVRDTALEIAISNGYEALNKVVVAAMYHDICKQCDEKEILKICAHADKSHYPTWHTLHGLAASIVAEEKLGLKDREVLNAIKNHCVPAKQMDTLSKIIYLADKLEPARTKEDIPNRKKYLNLACRNIDEAFKKVHKITQEKY